jgi:ArsR family transcriptional regulator
MKRTEGPNSVSDRLSALSEPVRLRMLRVLEREELNVGELARVVQLPQSTVSRHLKVLADQAWIFGRAEGTSTLYRLVLDDLPLQWRALWLTVREQMEDSRDLADDTRRLQAVLDDRRTDTQGFFGRVAGEWDGVRNELFGERITLAAMLPLLPPEWVVADLGCGTGNAAELLAPCVKRVVAIDQSEPMLAAAQKRLHVFKNIEFVRGDLEKLPIQAGSMDAAVCMLVLHHIESPELVCAEISRILKPGGVALIVDMCEHDRVAYKHTMGHRWLGFGVPQMIRMLTTAGLERPRFQTLPCDTSSKGPGLFACAAYKPAK